LARIAGVNLPREKRLEVGLTYIYGIGPSAARKVCAELGLSADEKVRDLTDPEITKLRNYIDGNLQVEGDLRRVSARRRSSGSRRSAPIADSVTGAACR
jgi:small subunit ribosomal protein S13